MIHRADWTMGISFCGTKGMSTANKELQLRNDHSFLYHKTTYLSLLHKRDCPNVVEELKQRHCQHTGLLEHVAAEYRDVGKLRKRILEVCVSSSSSSSCAVIRIHRTHAQPHAGTQVSHSARTARTRTVRHEFLHARLRSRLLKTCPPPPRPSSLVRHCAG